MSKSNYSPNDIEDPILVKLIPERINKIIQEKVPENKLLEYFQKITETDVRSSNYSIANKMRTGKSVYLKYYANFARKFRINLFHLFNPYDNQRWNRHSYRTYNELKVLDRNIRMVCAYGKYTKSFLNQVDSLSGGKCGIVLPTTAMDDTSDLYTTEWLFQYASINRIIRLSKITNIPLHVFFNPESFAFERYMKDHCIPQSRYETNDDFLIEGGMKDLRSKKAEQIHVPGYWKNAGRMPITHDDARKAIMMHMDKLLYDHALTPPDLSRIIHVSYNTIDGIVKGINSHLVYYFRICDYFHITFSDLIDPNVAEFHTTDIRHSNIDLTECFRFAYQNKMRHLQEMKSSMDIKEYHCQRDVLQKFRTRAIFRRANNSKKLEPIMISTFLDYCEFLGVTPGFILYRHYDEVIRTEEPQELPVQIKTESSVNEASTSENSNFTEVVIPTEEKSDLPDKERVIQYLAEIYDSLTEDQIHAIMTILNSFANRT